MDPIINYRRLEREAPQWRHLELDYQPNATVTNMQINATIFASILIYLLAIGLAAVTALDSENLRDFAIKVLWTVYSLLPTTAIALLIYTRGDWKKTLGWCLKIALLPTFLVLVFTIVQFEPLLVFLHLFVLIVTAYFVDRFVKHFYFWLTANYRIPPDVRRQRRDWFNNRFRPSKIVSTKRELLEQATKLRESGDTNSADLLDRRAAEAATIASYRRGLILATALFFLLAYTTLVLPNFISRWFTPTMFLFFVPPAIAAVRQRRMAPGYAGFLRTLKVVGHATVSWFTYAQTAEDVPGVFASPAGRRINRVIFAVIAFCLLPTAWTHVLVHSIPDFRSHEGVFFVGFVIASVFAPIYVFTTLILVAGPTLMLAYRTFSPAGDTAEKNTTVTDWEAYITRLQASKTPLEAEHLWLGIHPIDDFPVLLHRDILQEHAYIVGDSGSGKTALGVTPIVAQLIRQRHAAVVILDLKGDASLFQTTRAEAAAAGADFKFFTNELNRSTYIFNPFGLADSQHISLNQLCETFLEALSLNHGEGYGRSYFSRMARHWLAGALRKNPNLESFEQLYEYTRLKGAFQNAEERERVFELISVIESLATFEQLNLTPARAKNNAQAAEHAIVMPEVIREKQVVYFWLPAAVEAATVREIAKLALYSLMNAAYFFDRTNGDGISEVDSVDAPAQRAQTYLVIDEFQRIASGNFKIILEQARSMGIGAILAN
ncbi:MAG TPA: hypothetical protein PLJ47_10895, partial [Candidatus Hydrogenedentes bacterium]|nr:hypothetical protein [Candidatus Hydrogenedentota bacterium]